METHTCSPGAGKTETSRFPRASLEESASPKPMRDCVSGKQDGWVMWHLRNNPQGWFLVLVELDLGPRHPARRHYHYHHKSKRCISHSDKNDQHLGIPPTYSEVGVMLNRLGRCAKTPGSVLGESRRLNEPLLATPSQRGRRARNVPCIKNNFTSTNRQSALLFIIY